MSELSIFIDESGDFGAFEPHAPYYFLTLVFHDQSKDISERLATRTQADSKTSASLRRFVDAYGERVLPNHHNASRASAPATIPSKP